MVGRDGRIPGPAPGRIRLRSRSGAICARLAQNPALFRFLGACTPNARAVQGDARLTLGAPQDKADFLLIDAFSSAAIPTRLLTLEAIGLFLARTENAGVLAFHISNRHMDLSPI